MEESKKLTSIQNGEPEADLSVLDLIDNVIGILMPSQQSKIKNFTLFPFKKDKIVRLCQ